MLLSGVLLGLGLAPWPARAQLEPIPSFKYLPTGNGYGFQVFDVSQNAVTQFLERPYRYMRPNPSNPDGEGIVRRDLAFDTYFGVRSGSSSVWLGKSTPTEVGYVDQTNVIRSVVPVGALRTESFFFSPYGFQGNALVMVLTVTNQGTSAASVDAFSVHNFKMGSAPNPDEPGANSETVTFDTSALYARETGPGGGVMVYAPIGGADVSSCAAGAWDAVKNGQSLTASHNCSGSDQINVFQKGLGSLGPGESRSWGVAVLFDDSGDAAGARARWNEFLAGRDARKLLDDALAEWEAWRAPIPGLSSAERQVWRQSEAVLRMGQVLEPYSESPKRKGHGMVLASLPPGGWHSGWVRDAVYALVALARIGHWEEARWGIDFFLNADAGKYKSYLNDVDYRISTVRYFGNGEEEADYSGQPTRNIEIDGWGLVLWAARVYVDFSGDVAWLTSTTRKGDTVYEALKHGVAEPLIANLEPEGMAIADASIWEVHWGNREHFAYTTAAAARGLCDMAALARRMGDMADRDRYKMYAERAVEALRTHFIDQNNVLAGSLEKLARGSNYRDGAVVEAFTWNLIPPTDAITIATMNDMSYLLTPVGGYKRVEGSSDQYDSDEWILIDLRAADVFRRIGQVQRADTLLDFVTAQARVNYDLIPELYNTNANSGQIGRYTGSIPMVGYGAGAYMLTILSRAGHFEYTDCGTEEPPVPGDGGPSYIDAGPEVDGGGAGFDSRTGVACVCTTGGAVRAALGLGEALLLLLFAALVVADRLRRRAR